MSGYSVEINDKIQSFNCPHCGEESKTVWGWVSKNSTAHAVYYVNLMTGHKEPSARITVRREGKSELLRCSISASDRTEPVGAIDEEGAVIAGQFTAVARGPNFYLLTESALYELQRQ